MIHYLYNFFNDFIYGLSFDWNLFEEINLPSGGILELLSLTVPFDSKKIVMLRLVSDF